MCGFEVVCGLGRVLQQKRGGNMLCSPASPYGSALALSYLVGLLLLSSGVISVNKLNLVVSIRIHSLG